MTPSQALPAVLAKIDAGLEASLARLFEFLKIHSISTDPAYKDQCKAAAEFVARDLSGLGFGTSVRPTAGHPVVVGKSGNGHGHGPRVLFYGHFDLLHVEMAGEQDARAMPVPVAALADHDRMARGRPHAGAKA